MFALFVWQQSPRLYLWVGNCGFTDCITSWEAHTWFSQGAVFRNRPNRVGADELTWGLSGLERPLPIRAHEQVYYGTSWCTWLFHSWQTLKLGVLSATMMVLEFTRTVSAVCTFWCEWRLGFSPHCSDEKKNMVLEVAREQDAGDCQQLDGSSEGISSSELQTFEADYRSIAPKFVLDSIPPCVYMPGVYTVTIPSFCENCDPGRSGTSFWLNFRKNIIYTHQIS